MVKITINPSLTSSKEDLRDNQQGSSSDLQGCASTSYTAPSHQLLTKPISTAATISKPQPTKDRTSRNPFGATVKFPHYSGFQFPSSSRPPPKLGANSDARFGKPPALEDLQDAQSFPPLPTRKLPPSFEMVKTQMQNPEINLKQASTQNAKTGTKSFREAVSANWSSEVDVSFAPSIKSSLSTLNGEPALLISEEEKKLLAVPFQFTLVGRFDRGRPAMTVIRKQILAAAFQGECHTGLIDHRNVLFKFELEADFHRMWLKKIWTFNGFQAKMSKWSPDFNPKTDSTIVPVWVKFPSLPIYLFNKEKLFSLGSAVGKPLKLDLASAAAERILRPSEARVCVEVDVLKPIPSRVWIGSTELGWWQSIIVEDLPEYCSQCKRMGHSVATCKQIGQKKLNAQKVWKPIAPITKPSSGPETITVIAEEDEHPESFNETEHVQRDTIRKNEKMKVVQAMNLTDLEVPEPSSLSLITLPRSPLFCVQEKLNQFFTNLGQFLELINNQEAETQEMQEFMPPKHNGDEMMALTVMNRAEMDDEVLAGAASPLADETGADQGTGLVSTEARNEKSWFQRELLRINNASLSMTTQVQPPLENNGEILNIEYQFEKSHMEILSEMEKIKCNTRWEDGEPSSVFRVKSSSDLTQSQYVTESEYEADEDGFDRWTENSYEEQPEDALSHFISKMEKSKNHQKQTKYSEALVSPKATDFSGRKLRDRNPRICYSESKNWNWR